MAKMKQSDLDKAAKEECLYRNLYAYLEACVRAGKVAAELYNWQSVDCVCNGIELSADELHERLYQIIIEHINS